MCSWIFTTSTSTTNSNTCFIKFYAKQRQQLRLIGHGTLEHTLKRTETVHGVVHVQQNQELWYCLRSCSPVSPSNTNG